MPPDSHVPAPGSTAAPVRRRFGCAVSVIVVAALWATYCGPRTSHGTYRMRAVHRSGVRQLTGRADASRELPLSSTGPSFDVRLLVERPRDAPTEEAWLDLSFPDMPATGHHPVVNRMAPNSRWNDGGAHILSVFADSALVPGASAEASWIPAGGEVWIERSWFGDGMNGRFDILLVNMVGSRRSPSDTLRLTGEFQTR